MAEHVVVSPRVYFAVFATLLLLTGATVWVASLNLGAYNLVVALMIAVLKASLVVLYFMHVRYSPKLIWLVVVASLAWLALLILGTFHDYLSRSWLGVPLM
jgi:cytochrome c oxidase subunit 4